MDIETSKLISSANPNNKVEHNDVPSIALDINPVEVVDNRGLQIPGYYTQTPINFGASIRTKAQLRNAMGRYLDFSITNYNKYGQPIYFTIPPYLSGHNAIFVMDKLLSKYGFKCGYSSIISYDKSITTIIVDRIQPYIRECAIPISDNTRLVGPNVRS